MVIDPPHKRFVMNMQLRQGFARAKPIRLKISQIFLAFFISKKTQNFKIWLQKIQIDNPATQDLRMCIKYARKLPISVMYRSQENLVFLFTAETLSNA